MILNINDDKFLENPNADQVMAVVTSLRHDQFAILTRAEENYVQTYHNDDGTFQLEFRAGSPNEHYGIVGDSVSSQSVAEAFVAYLSGAKDWKSKWEWEQVEFDDDFEGDLTSENAYLLNGEEFEKVAVGDERQSIVNADGRCTRCHAFSGEYHNDECENEECPRCHGLLQSCDCE